MKTPKRRPSARRRLKEPKPLREADRIVLSLDPHQLALAWGAAWTKKRLYPERAAQAAATLPIKNEEHRAYYEAIVEDLPPEYREIALRRSE